MGKQSKAAVEKVAENDASLSAVKPVGKAVSAQKVAADAESPKKSWTIEDSEELYRIQGWGEPYFSINAAGHVTVSPQGDRGGSLDLFELVNALKQRI